MTTSKATRQTDDKVSVLQVSTNDRPKSSNVTTVSHRVPLEARWAGNGHKSGILWLTGLSGSGKSTLAIGLEEELFRRGVQTYVLDGDNVRQALSADLGFSPEDRQENIRRVGELAIILAQAGFVVITAFISPYRQDRDRIRARAGDDFFHEVFLSAPVEACEKRDPKGLYARARTGEIPEFTGVSAPYEAPRAPELVVPTSGESVSDSLDRLVAYALETFSLDRTGD